MNSVSALQGVELGGEEDLLGFDLFVADNPELPTCEARALQQALLEANPELQTALCDTLADDCGVAVCGPS